MRIEDLPNLALAWLTANGIGLLSAAAVLVAGWYLSRFTARAIRRVLGSARGLDRNLAPLLSEAARYAVMIFAIVTALGFLGVNNSSILAVLGAAGLAIVLSLQNTLSNIAAGVMLIWLRPIAIGEYITGDGVAGVVVEIGLFGTRLRSTSGLYVFTPNLKLWNSAITNHSREPRRRIEVQMTVPDDIDVGRARRLLLKLATTDKRVVSDPAPTVHVDSFSGSTINMQLRCWSKTPDYLPTLYALTEGAKLALSKELKENARKAEVTVTPDPVSPSPDTVETHSPGD
jgi:small conductance mechanosensitive channel